MPTESELADAIAVWVSANDYATFAELGRHIPGFGGGEYDLAALDKAGNPTIILWGGLTEAGSEAVRALCIAQRVHYYPTNILPYLADGAVLRLPLVTTNRVYTAPHWLPVLLRAGAYPQEGYCVAGLGLRHSIDGYSVH